MPKVGKFVTQFCGEHTEFPITYTTAKEEFTIELPPAVVLRSGGKAGQKGFPAPTQKEAEKLATRLLREYEESIKNEMKVILYEYDRASDTETWEHSGRVYWWGFKVKWRLAWRVTMGDSAKLFEFENKRAIYDHSESWMEWTPDREKFFVDLCNQLKKMEAGAALFFAQEGAGDRIDAMIPRLKAGGSLFTLHAPQE